MRDVVETVVAQADDTVEALRELVRTPSVTGDEAAAHPIRVIPVLPLRS